MNFERHDIVNPEVWLNIKELVLVERDLFSKTE